MLQCAVLRPPHPLLGLKIQTNDRKVRRLAAAHSSEVQGPPLPPRQGPVAVGTRLHFHEGDGELVAFPVVPVDALGRRKASVSDPPR